MTPARPLAYRGMTRAAWEHARAAGCLAPTPVLTTPGFPQPPPRLYFTTDPGLAWYYARLWAERAGGEPVVVSFPMPASFVPDVEGMSWGSEYLQGGTGCVEFYTHEAVPVCAVSVCSFAAAEEA